MYTGSHDASARTNSTMAGSTPANTPGQLSRLCGHEIQVASCGAHSAGKLNPSAFGQAVESADIVDGYLVLKPEPAPAGGANDTRRRRARHQPPRETSYDAAMIASPTAACRHRRLVPRGLAAAARSWL